MFRASIQAFFLFALVACASAQFSENSCIVLREFVAPSCSGVDEVQDLRHLYALNETQLVFPTLEDAIKYCPYSPALIEFTGTLYVNESAVLKYHGTSDIIFRGVSQFLGPDYELDAVMIGFKDLYISEHGVGVKFQNFDMHGCGTSANLFANYENGCIVDHSLSVDFMFFTNFTTESLICQIGSLPSTTFELTNSAFSHIPNRAVEVRNSAKIDIRNNGFVKCGNENDSCIFTSVDNSSDTEFIISDNQFD